MSGGHALRSSACILAAAGLLACGRLGYEQLPRASPDGGSSLDAARLDASSTGPRRIIDLPSDCTAPLWPARSTGAARTTVVVRPQQADELVGLVASASAGTTFLLADGTYDLPGTLAIAVPEVVVRSQSGDREAVVLTSSADPLELVYVTASDVVLADMSLRGGSRRGIRVTGGAGADAKRVALYNLGLRDAGGRSAGAGIAEVGAAVLITREGSTYADDGVVACSQVEWTAAARTTLGAECGMAGIGASYARGWHVYGNTFRDVRCESRAHVPAIGFSAGSRDNVVERNSLANCFVGIRMGSFPDQASVDGRTYQDEPCAGDGKYHDHVGGMVRNNMIWSEPGVVIDSGVAVWQGCDTQLVHNTVFLSDVPYSAFEWRYDDTTVRATNNVSNHGFFVRDASQAELVTNLWSATVDLFVDAASGDLHLAPGATQAIDLGTQVAGQTGVDFDGQARDARPDLGADELD